MSFGETYLKLRKERIAQLNSEKSRSQTEQERRSGYPSGAAATPKGNGGLSEGFAERYLQLRRQRSGGDSAAAALHAPYDMKQNPYGRTPYTQGVPSVSSRPGGNASDLENKTQWEIYREALDREQERYLANAEGYTAATEDLLSYDRNALRTDLQGAKGPKLSQQKVSPGQMKAQEQYAQEAAEIYPHAKALGDAEKRFYSYDHSLRGYQDKVDSAIRKGDWEAAKGHLSQMSQESFSPEDRTEAVKYIDRVTDREYLHSMADSLNEGKNNKAGEEAQAARAHILDLADRGNWEELYNLMHSEEGKAYKQLLRDGYGIDADSSRSRENNYMGLVSQLELGDEYGFESLASGGESYKTMLGTTAFTDRAGQEVQKAQEHEGSKENIH